MKDIIIEAGKRLGEYLREELDGRVTQVNIKRLNAVATDLLPGEKYEHVRLFMTRCEKYHLFTKYAESDLEWEARIGEIVHTLVSRSLMTKESARNAAALVVIICEGTAEAEKRAITLFAEEESETQVKPEPESKEPQTTTPQTGTTTPEAQKEAPQHPTPEAQKGAPLQTTTPVTQKGTPLQTTAPVTTGGEPEFVIENGVLKKYNGSGNSVTIPKGVVEIGAAFFNKEQIKSVTIPDSVKIIGNKSFAGCKSLKNIKIPNGVEEIGIGAFEGCESFTSIIVPNSVKRIGYSAFSGCSSLSSITIPFVGGGFRRETDTDQNPFGYIFGKTKYNGSLEAKQIFVEKFDSGYKKETYYIPSSLKTVTVTAGYILAGAFSSCCGLVNVTIPYVKKIGNQAFQGCTNLQSVKTHETAKVGEGVFIDVRLGAGVFVGCPKITYSGYVVENGVLKEYTGNSKSIIIPDIVTEIGEKAFYECASIRNITIPASVTIIGQSAFYKCKEVESITVKERNPVFRSAGNCLIKTDTKTLVYGCKNSVIPSDGSVTIIGSSAFYGCVGLTNITIPEGVALLRDHAFYLCEGLLKIKIPGSVKAIQDYAFQECKNLKSVEICDGVESIGWQAFCGCSNLERVTIPKSVKTIGEYAFIGCPKLTIYKAGGLNIFEQMFGTKWNPDKRPVKKL